MMRTVSGLLFIVIGVFTLIPFAGAEGLSTTLPIKKLDFHTGPGIASQNSLYTAVAGAKQLTLTDPDYPVNATEWSGKLTVTDMTSKRSCATRENRSVLEVYAPEDGQFAVLLSHDAQARIIDFVDLQTCQYRYPSIQTDSEQVQISYNQIVIFPWCFCPPDNKDKVCECHAAQVYSFSTGYKPVLAEDASKKLTQQEIGVGFVGTEKIQGPRTKGAKRVGPK